MPVAGTLLNFRVQCARIAIPYLMKRLTIFSIRYLMILRCGTYGTYQVKTKGTMESPRGAQAARLGSRLTICTAQNAAAPLRRARDHPPSLHRHKTTKDGPTLQGDWGCSGIGSRLDSGPDIELRSCLTQWHAKGCISQYQLLPVPRQSRQQVLSRGAHAKVGSANLRSREAKRKPLLGGLHFWKDIAISFQQHATRFHKPMD